MIAKPPLGRTGGDVMWELAIEQDIASLFVQQRRQAIRKQ